MDKRELNIKRIQQLKNPMYVKIDSATGRFSPQEMQKYRKMGFHFYAFVETDDGEDIILSYYPRWVNHVCDVLSNVDLGLTSDPEGISEMSYDELDEAGAYECDDLDEFLSKNKKQPPKSKHTNKKK